MKGELRTCLFHHEICEIVWWVNTVILLLYFSWYLKSGIDLINAAIFVNNKLE